MKVEKRRKLFNSINIGDLVQVEGDPNFYQVEEKRSSRCILKLKNVPLPYFFIDDIVSVWKQTGLNEAQENKKPKITKIKIKKEIIYRWQCPECGRWNDEPQDSPKSYRVTLCLKCGARFSKDDFED